MKKYMIILVLFSYSVNLFSGSNYSASFTTKHIQDRTYEFNLTLFKDTISTYPYLFMKVGNNVDTLYKISQEIHSGFAMVKYKGNYTFSSDGNYSIIVDIGSRENGIMNIPNSVNKRFSLKIELEINSFIGINNSSFDSIPLIDSAIVNQVFSVNLSSNDIDGDSLSYKLKPCRGEDGNHIPGYTYPAQPPVFVLDSITGILTWNTPQYQGEYSVLIQIEEWRSGSLISYTEREHFIVVNLGSGINNANDKLTNKVEVFPNPSSEIVYIKLTNSNEVINEIEIFNVIGKQVYSELNIQNSTTKIDVRGYKNGVYYYRIINSNKDRYSGKIIVY